MSRVSSIYDFRKRPDSPSYDDVYHNYLAELNARAPTDAPERMPVRDVVCGSTKIIGSCLAFPVLCPLNFTVGTVMTVYGCLCCRICEPAYENRRNEFCAFCGIIPSAQVSMHLFQTGASEIRRACCVTQEMVR